VAMSESEGSGADQRGGSRGERKTWKENTEEEEIRGRKIPKRKKDVEDERDRSRTFPDTRRGGS
jgi:hypothetical protein